MPAPYYYGVLMALQNFLAPSLQLTNIKIFCSDGEKNHKCVCHQ